jgi:sirohydrochlorin cobaltochelatase
MNTPSASQNSVTLPAGGVGQRPGVILVAHGSARSAASAEPVLALADGLRDRGFPEVRTAFWKEEPFLHQALELTRCSTVAVLPVFLSEGYFSSTVVPRELGLRYGDNHIGERLVHLLPPLGTDAGLAEIVAARAQEGVPPDACASEVLLVVLGHGTQRDPASADAVLDVCARLGREGRFAQVAPAFIDQEPRLENVLKDAREPVILLVPFLVAAGWHGGTTVPRELDPGSHGIRHGRQRIVYTEPVGTHPALVELAEALLLGTALPPEPSRSSSALPPLTRLESVLEERLARSTTAVLIQVMIRVEDRTVHELRHVDDDGVDPEHLTEIATASALGSFARRRDDGGARPLRTAADLPRGWRLRASCVRDLIETLVEVYGSALVHWHLGETDELSGVSFRETTAGQTGIYATLTQVEAMEVEAGVRSVCDGLPCLRTRLWGVEDTVTMVKRQQEEAADRLVVPCPRPCPILLSGVLDLVADGKSRDVPPLRQEVDDPPSPD